MPLAIADLVLERFGPDGTREAVAPGPREIHEAIERARASFLGPAEPAGTLRFHGVHADGVAIDLEVLSMGDEVVVRCTRGGELRWLGRGVERAPFTIRLHDGRVEELPALARVPWSWASSTVSLLAMSPGWTRAMPWHDAAFAPMRPAGDDASAFSFERFTGSRVDERSALSSDLARFVGERLARDEAQDEVIAELRRVGHDLWSWDSDGHWELWGSDYMRVAPGQGLSLRVVTVPPVSVEVAFDGATASWPSG